MFTFLLVVHALIAAMLVGVILMQKSEGGGLGMGGSPSGLMSARGAADFLTRATTILATLFVILSIFMAVLATRRAGNDQIDTSLARSAPAAPAPNVPLQGDPLAAAAGAVGNGAVPAAPPSAASGAPVPIQTAPAPAAKPAQREARRPVTSSASGAVRVAPTSPAEPRVRVPVVPTQAAPAPAAAPAVSAPAGNSN